MPTIQPRDHLRGIHRSNEHHEGRSRFICLDRNERASPFPATVLTEMMASVGSRDISAYPDAGPFVARLAALTRLSEDWIAETAGSDAAVRRILMAYVRPGSAVVCPNPSYAMYAIYARVFEGIVRCVDYQSDRSLDVDAFLRAITPDASVVIVANPDQPLGTALPQVDLVRIVAHAAEIGAVCVIDEAYYPFHAATVLPLVRDYPNLVVTRTLSKYPGVAGLRLGYAAASPDLIKGLVAVRGGSEISGVSLALGCYLLDHPEIAETFLRDAELGRSLLVNMADDLGFETPACVASFQLLRCPQDIVPDDFALALERRGYLVKAGFEHPSMRGCVRISLNGLDIMSPFVKAMGDAVAELRSAPVVAQGL